MITSVLGRQDQFRRQYMKPRRLQEHFEKHGTKSVLHRTDGLPITRPGLGPVRTLFIMPKFDVSFMSHEADLIRKYRYKCITKIKNVFFHCGITSCKSSENRYKKLKL